ncbi:MAG: copper chaperone PCu(A)C [Oligoflexia bacterium]|nr:copper chaperone PCu(A)C [Oligoflexia bacterium]
MKKTLLNFLIIFIFTTHAQAKTEMTISEGIIYNPMKGSIATAGYGVLKNESNQDVLVKIISAEGFKTVELHETKMADGMMQMNKVESFRIEKKSSFTFEQGGNHIMLFNATKEFKENDLVPVTFKINDKKVVLTFKIKSRMSD